MLIVSLNIVSKISKRLNELQVQLGQSWMYVSTGPLRETYKHMNKLQKLSSHSIISLCIEYYL